MNRFFHSVRWRLQLWHALILGVVIAVLCTLAHRLVSNDRTERIDRDLRTFERAFYHHVRDGFPEETEESRPPSITEIRSALKSLTSPSGFPLNLRGLFNASATEGTYIVFWDSDGTPLFRSANSPASLTPPADSKDGGSTPRSRPPFREIARSGPGGLKSVVGRDVSSEHASLRNLALSIGLSGAALWAIGLLGGWWLAGRAIRPIESISRTASRIAGGEVSERIDIAGTDDELAQLSRTLNDTFARLEASIRRQREFTADASHELRTPLTVILSETSRGLKRERSTDEYRELLETCQHAGTRMKGLVEALLVLARHDSPAAEISREPTDLALLAADTAALLKNLAAEREIRLESELNPAPCQGDPAALTMAITNLLANAIHHQPHGGSATLRTFSENGQAVLEVSDTGPGIPEEHLPRLFDRFYRIDSSRAAGHSGLGLAIVKAIAEAHGGSVTASSELGKGSTFRISLPVG